MVRLEISKYIKDVIKNNTDSGWEGRKQRVGEGEKGGKEVRRADKKNLTLKRPVLWKSDKGIKK